MIEIRHLRYFLAVAESGSVAEAARRLHIAQPALSRQVRELEERLGAALFVRGVKGVKLTTAGAQFRLDAQQLLDELAAARERVAHIARGQQGALRLGVAPNYSWHPVILRSLQAFKHAVPGVTVMLEPSLAARQLERIARGSLDGGYLTWRNPADPAYSAVRLFDCRLKLALHRHSSLAESPPHRLADLQDEPCIWFRREIAPAYNDFLTHQCHVAGLSPRTLQIGSDVSTILGLVAAGMGYSIVSDASTYHCPADVILLDHPDLTMTYPVEFVWRTADDNPVLARFVEVLRDGLAGLPAIGDVP
ncbi:LysR family transcriptional regulator [Ralstonia sp. UBA689]|uniref:LysR family transcriptional regulator n=1 Tax=Ralstonia sp. UBA689 TaxID=1947373 RepID=UPI0025DD72DB|nr:LysR family transcriptional regulator [Ralstonia sp. UBA689]